MTNRSFSFFSLFVLATFVAFADDNPPAGLTLNPASLAFTVTAGAPIPAQILQITASHATRFTVRATVQGGGPLWLAVSPSGTLTTNQRLSVSVNPSGLPAGSYSGAVNIVGGGRTYSAPVQLTVAAAGGSLKVSPGSLSFAATVGGAAPPAKPLSVTGTNQIAFKVSATGQSGGHTWLTASPSGSLTTPQTINVSANPAGLAAGTYTGAVNLTANGTTQSVAVSFTVASAGGGGGPSTGSYKIVGWNDLGMHCHDGADFSIFAVLPPYNTIHAHLMDASGTLVLSDIGYTVTYQAVTDPLTSTLNTTSASKTNFWKYAAALGFGSLAPDVGLKGFAMPGAGNVPQKMVFDTTDNTWVATGIPIMPYGDAAQAPFPVNYFPMMRLVAKDTLGTVLATSDIVLPVSDELNCATCHASNTGTLAAKPAAGWVGLADVAKDMKLNMLRKHDDRFAATALFKSAATQAGVNPAGLEASAATKPFLCASCHGSNALGLAGATGVEAMTTAMHGMHANVVDPATNLTLDSSTTRAGCYNCHPGPKTQCLRGAMGSLKDTSGANVVECQSCHGPMSNVAVATRSGWLDEPNCQSCHTGTATANNGQIVYTSVFSSGTIVRQPVDQTFATNANTPSAGLSLYRFSKGHGGLQCEGCHGSTHAEFATSIVNDNVESTALQGHVGMLSECSACHNPVPSTVTGGPHGLHPIGAAWVNSHQGAAEGGTAACQTCHGLDYRGTILSKTQADRTMAGKTFARGTVIGCYSCHNGPNGGG